MHQLAQIPIGLGSTLVIFMKSILFWSALNLQFILSPDLTKFVEEFVRIFLSGLAGIKSEAR